MSNKQQQKQKPTSLKVNLNKLLVCDNRTTVSTNNSLGTFVDILLLGLSALSHDICVL